MDRICFTRNVKNNNLRGRRVFTRRNYGYLSCRASDPSKLSSVLGLLFMDIEL